jgi:hypothetical protein
MKNLCIICAALVLVSGLAASAAAGEVKSIPASTLSSMGLGGVHQMSDSAGTAVRGMGTYAAAWGQSTSSSLGSTTTNGYQAIGQHLFFPAAAGGTNMSNAGSQLSFGFGSITFTTFAGGSSTAYAR